MLLRVSNIYFGQIIKGVWRMPRRLEAMKDVLSCEKSRGAAKEALIRECPNGATHLFSSTGIMH